MVRLRKIGGMRGARAISFATVIWVAVGLTGATTASAEPVEEQRVLYEASELDGTTAVDSSTFGNDGAMLGGVTRRDGVYRFHPVTMDGHYDRIRALPAPSLNPRSDPFSYGARVMVLPDAVWSHSEMAVVRHGDSDTAGGDYKLELDLESDGVVTAHCVMHDGDGDGSGYVKGHGLLDTINDGAWHEITCARVDVDTVSLTIDGHVTERSTSGALGSIRSKDPFLIGCQPFAKRPKLHFREQFDGSMDDIHMTVVKPEEPPPPPSPSPPPAA